MILSFKCPETRALFETGDSRRWKNILNVATRKLTMLHAATELRDLRSLPEALQGNRVGQYSIRINDQFRICFEWSDAGPTNVEIVDYH
ncbi:plasmid maintenance system killer protein [Pseudomonas daroniae]|uniref:Plasmid maintenance system killer protein n=1 Tax=Phytopseudomonas daroniae TaxID=2487519 RepID=A0A4Q9QHM0_9GAMM|nr:MULTISPECIES: type II toxin-antitoxin system RelE/ParE family toxin [Pseudomonas]TBU72415.1 plasmid maintenance system killer protein [Pseudomonas daroniae]TBU74269.1 plasmid maintenance system killer protein [Pseudomonas sp. FRB 228]TBU86521.1 plasmid maintenance system killer protein [Pseudomonas daroniae]